MKKLKVHKWTAQKVKALRLAHDLTQQQMAGIIGISQQVYARMETGKHEMGRMTKIAWDKIKDHLEDAHGKGQGAGVR